MDEAVDAWTEFVNGLPLTAPAIPIPLNTTGAFPATWTTSGRR